MMKLIALNYFTVNILYLVSLFPWSGEFRGELSTDYISGQPQEQLPLSYIENKLSSVVQHFSLYELAMHYVSQYWF